MKRYFTHYWTNKTWCDRSHWPGGLLSHTADNRFKQRGVTSGDSVYVITVQQGRFFLLCRLTVNCICNQHKAEQILKNCKLWAANDHVIASSATPKRFDFEVPTTITEKLLFTSSGHSHPLKFKSPGKLDQQTLRGVRELEPASARLLDELLPPERQISRANK